MRLLRADDVGHGRHDVVFRQSPAPALLTSLGLLAAAALVGFVGYRGDLPPILAALSGGSLLLFSVISATAARRALAPSNWLLATDGERLLLKFRSYLNAGVNSESPQVLELRREDLSGVRAVRVRQTGRGAGGDRLRDRSIFLDIALSPGVETAGLRSKLSEERELRKGRATWRHYPLTLLDEHTIRLEWRGRHARLKPGMDEALRALQWIAPLAPASDERLDLGDYGRDPVNDGGDRAIRQLAEQGRIIEATLLAQRTFGMTTTEARAFVLGRDGK